MGTSEKIFQGSTEENAWFYDALSSMRVYVYGFYGTYNYRGLVCKASKFIFVSVSV